MCCGVDLPTNQYLSAMPSMSRKVLILQFSILSFVTRLVRVLNRYCDPAHSTSLDPSLEFDFARHALGSSQPLTWH